MVSLFHFLDLFNDIFSTSDSMFSEVCWMLHNNFERMSCVPALPGGNEEKHENLIQDRLHPGQEPKLELLNPLSPELNPICYFLALLGAHHFLHVSRIRVKLLTFRRQMSYIYGALILDVSRSHTTTQHSR